MTVYITFYIIKARKMLYNEGDVTVVDSLIKKIRTVCNMTQPEFAEALQTTFATINRWENGHNQPGKAAQRQILEYCAANQIPVADIVLAYIKSQAEDIFVGSDRKLLYHGSKSGITGKIRPISREHCDFGAGFYMGTELLQPLTLVCGFEEAKFYVVSVRLDKVSSLTVESNLDWAMLVAYHRGKMERIRGSKLYQRYAEYLQGKDVVIGSIADDRMFYVLDNFFLGNITDTALVQSLSALELGQQYVAVTHKGCDQIRIEKEIPLTELEKECLKRMSEENRIRGISLADTICRKHRRDGKFFDEILDEAAGEVI